MEIWFRWCADPNGERLFGAAKPRQGEQEGKAKIIIYHRLFIKDDFSPTEYDVSLDEHDFSPAVHILMDCQFRDELQLFSQTLGAGTRKSRRGGVPRFSQG